MMAKDYVTSLEQLDGPNGIPTEKIVADQIFDYTVLNRFSQVRNFQPVLFCHDQEPLNFDMYQDGQPFMLQIEKYCKENYDFPVVQQNLRTSCVWSWRKSWILLHSEINSPELQKYESTDRYVGAYWWSHAALARDWYRYAKTDRALEHRKLEKLFLVYCRDTTGSREYRKTFLDAIVPIQHNCQIGSYGSRSVDSSSSAIYESEDFCRTGISVVLETLFDDPRIHLTEKTLRPIACGHPFLLAAGPGSLKLLKKYGFETFDSWIDESYDQELDSAKRLSMIVNEMQRVSELPELERSKILEACNSIAQRNKKHFFSNNFQSIIFEELIFNVDLAEQKCQTLDADFYLAVRRWRKINNPGLIASARTNRQHIIPFVRHLRQHSGSFEQYQSHQDSLDNKSSADGNDIE